MKKKYFGKYRAKVIDNQDPEKMGRLKLHCPKVLGDYESNWAVMHIPYAFDKGGSIRIPRVNEIVWVEFEGGDPEKPIVTGQWWTPNNTPIKESEYEEIDRYRRMKTESGHEITYYDGEGKEYVELITSSGHRMKFDDADGQNKIEIEDNKGNKIEFDTESNSLTISVGSAVTVTASTVTVSAGSIKLN
jgi:uncharacterized protein involved in type VI secretion and phage assembly